MSSPSAELVASNWLDATNHTSTAIVKTLTIMDGLLPIIPALPLRLSRIFNRSFIIA